VSVLTAEAEYDLELKVGRVLKGWPLSAVVAARNLLVGFGLFALDSAASAGGEALEVPGAPAWVRVRERLTGEVLLKVAAGRDAGAGPMLLEQMTEDARTLTPQAFLQRYG
jgi:hypothetical protein